MEKIEVTGKTVEEALTNASLELKTASDNLEYEVIEKGSSGLFGFINSKPAKILVWKKETDEDEADELVKPVVEKETKPAKENTKAEPVDNSVIEE